MRGRGLCAAGLALLLAGPLMAQDAPPLPGIEPPAARPNGNSASGPAMQIVADPAQPPAQTIVSPVLTVDQEQLFSSSAWGQRVQAELDAAGQRLDQENDRLYKQLVAEEAELTELRKTLEAAEFRQRADAFDTRATQIRREFAQSVDKLNEDLQSERTAFFQFAGPIMGLVMQERGALVVLDRRTALVSVGGINVTAELIARIDQELGDGAGLKDELDTPAPPAASGDTGSTEGAGAD